MDKSLVDTLDEHKEEALETLTSSSNYESMVEYLVSLHPRMDKERITKIDHGDYQGTLVFVVGAEGYQPYDYWYVKVGYGSCSWCDALEGARGYGEELTPEQKEGMYKLLHDIASGFRLMNSEDAVA